MVLGVRHLDHCAKRFTSPYYPFYGVTSLFQSKIRVKKGRKRLKSMKG